MLNAMDLNSVVCYFEYTDLTGTKHKYPVTANDLQRSALVVIRYAVQIDTGKSSYSYIATDRAFVDRALAKAKPSKKAIDMAINNYIRNGGTVPTDRLRSAVEQELANY